jgi:hypothetical protein
MLILGAIEHIRRELGADPEVRRYIAAEVKKW